MTLSVEFSNGMKLKIIPVRGEGKLRFILDDGVGAIGAVDENSAEIVRGIAIIAGQS